VHAPAPTFDDQELVRTGYRGARRTILVVDNEHVDRTLLVNILAPLGFAVVQAESGTECVQRYAALRPDLILMDLAMPGMDGWEASYLIRKVHQSAIPIAIVSANAYDKGMENPAGIGADDFIVKPVNVAELLDWVGRRLQLDWITAAAPKSVSSEIEGSKDALVLPPPAHLDPLREQVALGYVRGVLAQLDSIDALAPQYARFTAAMRGHAARFDLDAMAAMLRAAAPKTEGERDDVDVV
jgi:CheY-like chemotaxis protein